MKKLLIPLIVLMMTSGCASTTGAFSATSTPLFKVPPSTFDRTLIVISDLHMGVGKKADKTWYPTEDFRWPKAFKAFLDEISKQGNDRVDLVIAGDLLEMWQPAEHLICEGLGHELGCTTEQMQKIASWIIQAHAETFEDLKQFALKGGNRLYILPGNHDASLMVASVWEPLGKALGVGEGRVNFAVKGDWNSVDGRIVVEHGHQIKLGPNRYDTWPDIVRNKGGRDYIVRPWGEQFLQKLFTRKEKEDYQIIDNLQPETTAIGYLMQGRGTWGTASDMAKFVYFNVSQASFPQVASFLGDTSQEDKPPEWNITRARTIGHRLFLAGLPTENPLRTLIENSDEGKQIREELDKLALDTQFLPDESVKLLCDEAAIHGDSVCSQPSLGGLLQQLLVSKTRIFETYLAGKHREFPQMLYFIWGDTHILEEAWPEKGISGVKVLNSGAFQRVIDKGGFLRRVEKMCPPSEGLRNIRIDKGLRNMKIEELPPCYTFIRVSYKKDSNYEEPVPNLEVLRWAMEETGLSGRIVNVGDEACE